MAKQLTSCSSIIIFSLILNRNLISFKNGFKYLDFRRETCLRNYCYLHISNFFLTRIIFLSLFSPLPPMYFTWIISLIQVLAPVLTKSEIQWAPSPFIWFLCATSLWAELWKIFTQIWKIAFQELRYKEEPKKESEKK